MPNIPNLPESLQGAPGVDLSVPPERFLGQTNALITDAVRQIRSDKSHLVTVWIRNTAGVNVAYVGKVGDQVRILGYAGKKWGAPVEAGIALAVEW